MEGLKKIGCFLALFLVVIGGVTALVLAGQAHQWVAFVGELLVLAAAVPTLVTLGKYLING